MPLKRWNYAIGNTQKKQRAAQLRNWIYAWYATRCIYILHLFPGNFKRHFQNFDPVLSLPQNPRDLLDHFIFLQPEFDLHPSGRGHIHLFGGIPPIILLVNRIAP